MKTLFSLNLLPFIQQLFIHINITYAMNHELPKLPYALNALEPVISEKTMEFHYEKHHQTYITNLNSLIKGTEFEDMPLEDIIKKSEGVIFNNAAQVWNHTFYFLSLKPKGDERPLGKLAEMINETWGSFEEFKNEFNKTALSLFGSGWVWLAKDNLGNLSILKENNAGNPLIKRYTPILTFDVWEHAYYLDYQNRRTDHIHSIWNIINWKVVSKRY